MKYVRGLVFVLFGLLLFLLTVSISDAHEVYVLTKAEYASGLANNSVNLLQAFKDPVNIFLTVKIVFGIVLLYCLSLWFSLTKKAKALDSFLIRYKDYSSLIIRLALAITLFIGAYFNVMFGPELRLTAVPFGEAIRAGLYFTGGLLLLGLGTELAALLVIAFLVLATLSFGVASFSYLDIAGVATAFLLFGSRFYSLDQVILDKTADGRKHYPDQFLITRVGLGLTFIAGAIGAKLLHPGVALAVISKYHLTQFHWFFPPDPNLLILGAALVEIVIGLSLIVGFQIRLTTLIVLFYLTLSLFFFKETVWPHLIIYVIAIALFIAGGGKPTLDNWLAKRVKSKGL